MKLPLHAGHCLPQEASASSATMVAPTETSTKPTNTVPQASRAKPGVAGRSRTPPCRCGGERDRPEEEYPDDEVERDYFQPGQFQPDSHRAKDCLQGARERPRQELARGHPARER